jgi:hypothetical protein
VNAPSTLETATDTMPTALGRIPWELYRREVSFKRSAHCSNFTGGNGAALQLHCIGNHCLQGMMAQKSPASCTNEAKVNHHREKHEDGGTKS